MQLGKIKCPPGSKKKPKRLGQGVGSGKGKTAGKGHKGQRSRSGAKRGRRIDFEGGQNPMHRRLPKIGFSNQIFRKTYQIVNLASIDASELEGEVGPDELVSAGLVKKKTVPIKILGNGDLHREISIKAHKFSRTAREKIGQAGGKVEVI